MRELLAMAREANYPLDATEKHILRGLVREYEGDTFVAKPYLAAWIAEGAL